MLSKKSRLDKDKMDQIIAEARRREKTYREQALKMYPWICARCGREFTGKKLRELTVHHKDHNHDYNPPDGSNWELLCVYCHDHEHAKYLDAESSTISASNELERERATARPFANLKDLLMNK